LHLIHSLDPATGGVLSAVQLLSGAINGRGGTSTLSADSSYVAQKDELVIAHGLWQWPGIRARTGRSPYLVFPHGMMDPWFKRTYPLKHLKKQTYWWYAQGRVMQDAYAVCFTTEEEKRLAQDTFFPYRPAREMVTGIGVGILLMKVMPAGQNFLKNFLSSRESDCCYTWAESIPKKGWIH